jgi:hypothetical protein
MLSAGTHKHFCAIVSALAMLQWAPTRGEKAIKLGKDWAKRGVGSFDLT